MEQECAIVCPNCDNQVYIVGDYGGGILTCRFCRESFMSPWTRQRGLSRSDQSQIGSSRSSRPRTSNYMKSKLQGFIRKCRRLKTLLGRDHSDHVSSRHSSIWQGAVAEVIGALSSRFIAAHSNHTSSRATCSRS
jgi:hypothetical protein